MAKFNYTSEQDIENIKTWKEYIDNGHFGNSKDIVDTYNRVFENIRTKQNYTNCGSCLRRCVRLMFEALTEYENDKLEAMKEIDKFFTEEIEDDEPIVEEKPKKTRKKQ